MTRISVFLIAQNEETRLPRTLAALGWADEIVLVDSGSTDHTIKVAERYSVKTHQRAFDGYGPQKVFAERQCTHDWLLNIDADEEVTPDLAHEIQRIVAENRPGAFKIRILNVYPGDRKPRRWANDYNVVRLYHRSAGGYRDHALHDRVETSVEPQQLTAPIHHHPLISWSHFVDKENRYSTYNADQAKPKNRTLLRLRLFVQMPVSFLKFYIFKGHILGGHKGFMFALTAAFARTLRLAKMLERSERP